MTPNAAKRLIAISDRFEPKLRNALEAAFESLQQQYTVTQIETALLNGGVGGVINLFSGMEGSFNQVRDILEEAAAASGRMWITVIPSEAILNPAFRFSIVNPNTAAFVRDYSLNLIRAISEDTREAVRHGLRLDVAAGRNPRETARLFRQHLGLTPRQEQAVRNYRNSLETGSGDALRRALRDKRSDSVVRRAMELDKPLSKKQIDSLVARYRKRYIKYRSEVIARTESLRAATVGQRASIRQALSQRAIDDSRLRRFWVDTKDKRTRDAHKKVAEMNPKGVGLEEPYQTPLGPLMYPRDPNGSGANTIQCRCAERYALVDAQS